VNPAEIDVIGKIVVEPVNPRFATSLGEGVMVGVGAR
jgi:hypothetical protein